MGCIIDISIYNFYRRQSSPIGTYLIRTGGKGSHKAFALTLRSPTQPSGFDHYRIEVSDGKLFIEEDLKFSNFQELISTYQQEKLPVLTAQLLYPFVPADNFQERFIKKYCFQPTFSDFDP